MIEALHYLVVAGIFWATICRARVMDADTMKRLKVQYGALLTGAVLSLPIFLPGQAGKVVLGSAVLVYLLIDARRWRHGVPR